MFICDKCHKCLEYSEGETMGKSKNESEEKNPIQSFFDPLED